MSNPYLIDALRKMKVGSDIVNSQVHEAANELEEKDRIIAELRKALSKLSDIISDFPGPPKLER